MKHLNRKQLNLLREAIDAADGWRGSVAGVAFSESEELEQDVRLLAFDQNIQAMRDALVLVTQQQKWIRLQKSRGGAKE